MTDTGLMGRTNKQQPTDRKPYRMVRIKQVLAAQIDVLVERNATDFTDEVNRAVRELLVREGLWPPPPKSAP